MKPNSWGRQHYQYAIKCVMGGAIREGLPSELGLASSTKAACLRDAKLRTATPLYLEPNISPMQVAVGKSYGRVEPSED